MFILAYCCTPTAAEINVALQLTQLALGFLLLPGRILGSEIRPRKYKCEQRFVWRAHHVVRRTACSMLRNNLCLATAGTWLLQHVMRTQGDERPNGGRFQRLVWYEKPSWSASHRVLTGVRKGF